MDDELYAFNQRDYEIWKQIRQAHLSSPPSRLGYDQPLREIQTPETYLARTPPSGIPALQDHGTGTTGTGTADDEPGGALCNCYQIEVATGTGTGTSGDDHIRPVPYVSHFVWNTSSEDVPGDKWITITRDKFGSWLYVNTDGVGQDGDDLERGRWAYVPSKDKVGDDTWQAYLLNKSGSSRYLGDEIRVKVMLNGGRSFVPGDYWVTPLSGEYAPAGTGTGDDFSLYDGVGNDRLIRPVCRADVIQYDKEWYYHPFLLQENAGSGTVD